MFTHSHSLCHSFKFDSVSTDKYHLHIASYPIVSQMIILWCSHQQNQATISFSLCSQFFPNHSIDIVFILTFALTQNVNQLLFCIRFAFLFLFFQQELLLFCVPVHCFRFVSFQLSEDGETQTYLASGYQSTHRSKWTHIQCNECNLNCIYFLFEWKLQIVFH